eukprot:TRINITY_DN8734_c0_g2_i2.p1 TRINITY_DN8734_c0_g2~~TRINITY_DN8734_c0_g2_i2.p1  ORF type:complete len:483 (+),score=58.29 TRINITY_DN8734_c0_g2_i2:150-1598(+)
MTTIFAVAVLAVTVGQQHVHAKPCPENSLFIYSYEHGEESHCACLEKTRCIGAKCVAGGAKNDVYGFYNTPYHSGFQSSCLDCYCLTSSQTASNVALSYPHKLRTSPDGQQFREFPDPLFEQSCRALPDHVPYKPPVALARQKWLHFPKAGSSFSSTIYHYACRNFPGARVFSDLNDPEIPVYQNTTCSFCWLPCGTKCGGFTFWAPHDGLNRRRKSKKGNYDYLPRPFLEKKCVSQLQGWMQAHYPMPRRSKTINGTGLAMFRHPARRLVSAFNYGRHSFGMNRLEKLRMLRVTPTLESYVNFPGIASCMTKMLLGQNCAHYVKLDSMLLEEAKRRVRYDLGFVGLSEHWNASICLFHRRYGGPMHPLELANLRPTGNGTEARKDVFNKVRQSVEGTETGRRLLSIEDECLRPSRYVAPGAQRASSHPDKSGQKRREHPHPAPRPIRLGNLRICGAGVPAPLAGIRLARRVQVKLTSAIGD